MSQTFAERVRDTIEFIKEMELSDAELVRALARNLEPDRQALESGRINFDAIVRVLADRVARAPEPRYADPQPKD